MQIRLPKRFLWGVTTSAHQIEGNQHNQWTIWELENARARASKAEYELRELDNWPLIRDRAKDPSNYVSSDAADHYKRYEEDLQIAKAMNLNAFRFSVEWSRIEPEEGAWNAEALQHYREYAARIKYLGMEPIVTLFHFSLPQWFALRGGFEKRANVKYFTRFAEKIIDELGLSVRFVVTMNDPVGYARESYYEHRWPPAMVKKRFKTWRVMNNLAYAHNRTAQAIHKLNRRYKLTVAYNFTYFYPGDNALLSRASAATLQFLYDDYFLGKVVKTCDFIGVNYYQSNRVYGYRIHNSEEKLADDGRDLSPLHLQFVLERLNREYKMPIIVTETGLADAQDDNRKWFISQQVLAIQKAIEHGVDVKGYLHRSLIDDFDWTCGKWARYGLVHIDYRTKKRTVRPSGSWYGKVVKKLRSEG